MRADRASRTFLASALSDPSLSSQEHEMNSAWTRTLCRLLVALMIWTPYQMVNAGMIGTDQAASASIQADRSTVLGFVNRADVASRLQSMGVDPKTAQERIASLSAQEVRSSARQINSGPAGAMANAWAVILIIAIVVGV